jgi:hypothetical protein
LCLCVSLSLSLSLPPSLCLCLCLCLFVCVPVFTNTLTHSLTHTQCRYGRPLGGGAAASHTDTSEVDLATINQIITDMDGATATSTAGNMGDFDNDLRCRFLQYDISQEGVQTLRNAGVCRLSDFHYIQLSDVRNMNMSLLDQRKTEKMLESWQATHTRGKQRTHGTLEDACDDLELPETAFPFEVDLRASRLHGDKFSC